MFYINHVSEIKSYCEDHHFAFRVHYAPNAISEYHRGLISVVLVTQEEVSIHKTFEEVDACLNGTILFNVDSFLMKEYAVDILNQITDALTNDLEKNKKHIDYLKDIKSKIIEECGHMRKNSKEDISTITLYLEPKTFLKNEKILRKKDEFGYIKRKFRF